LQRVIGYLINIPPQPPKGTDGGEGEGGGIGGEKDKGKREEQEWKPDRQDALLRPF
jgi:hypothetical protein